MFFFQPNIIKIFNWNKWINESSACINQSQLQEIGLLTSKTWCKEVSDFQCYHKAKKKVCVFQVTLKDKTGFLGCKLFFSGKIPQSAFICNVIAVLQLDINNRVQRPVALFQRLAMPFFFIYMIFPTIWQKDYKNWTKTKKSLKAEAKKAAVFAMYTTNLILNIYFKVFSQAKKCPFSMSHCPENALFALLYQHPALFKS